MGAKPPPGLSAGASAGILSLSSATIRAATLGPTPGVRATCPLSCKRNRVGEVRRRERAEHGERDLGADALHRLQRPEPGALMFGGEAVEPDRVLPHMGVDGERHGLARRRERWQTCAGAMVTS